MAQAIDLRLDLRTSLFPLGEHARILDVLRDVEALAERLDDPQRLGSIAGRLCFYFVAMGEYNRALAAGQRALALATTSGAVDVQLYAQANLGLAYSAVGDFGQTLDVSRQMMAWLTGERRYARAGQVGPLLGVIARGHVAGRAPEALPLLDQVLQRVATERHMFAHALVLTELSEALLLVGRVEEASTLAGRLLDLSLTLIGRGYQAHAYRLLGDVTIRRDPPDVDQAAVHYRQALALAEELGMRPLQAHCHRGLGILYVTTGQREQARAELSTAIALYRSMEMTFWLPQAEAALTQIGGVERPSGQVS